MVDGGLPFVHQFHLKAITFQLTLQGTAVGGYLFQFLTAFVPGTVRVENDTLIQGISTEKLIELTGEFGLFIRVTAIEFLYNTELTAVPFPARQQGWRSGRGHILPVARHACCSASNSGL